ncbi:MAG: hypothetical protein HYR88_17380 [Verrucomicrobia bacterium]|nr:hypothetical protein [Verrucomicrobiota bacterium]MBI3869866.1 hypothetical protein [Verrucomicrobiota bacterium]
MSSRAKSLCGASLSLLAVLAICVGLPSAQAAPPDLMTYQGFLVDGNGNALASSSPANYPVTFRIYTASLGGTRLWSEQQIVTVDKGNFSVILGEGTPIGGEVHPLLSAVMAGPAASDRYMSLSVTIGAATSEMLPRLRMLPAPYAFLATSANNLVNPGGTSVVAYANSRVEVNGNLFASGVISGNGSGLSGLTASQLNGTVDDSLLSANVALKAGGNAFTGNQTIAGNLGLSTPNTTFPLTIGNNTLGDKISLWGQSGNSFGFGVAPGLLQIHTDNPGSDIGFGYGSGAALTETMRIKGNGNVGIGVQQPGARLSLAAPGSAEQVGSVLSTTLRANAGSLGATAGSELALASIGFFSGNHSSLGLRGLRATAGSDWTSTAIGLEMDVDNTLRAGGGGLWMHANGNVGIGVTTPGAKLDVNGSIRSTSLTVNGPFTASSFNAASITANTINGEKPPQTYTVGPGANLNTWRELQMDTTALLGDADGGRIKVLLRDHGGKIVRTVSYEFYAENDTDNFGLAYRQFMTVSSFGTQRYFRLGTTDASDIGADYDWFWIRNYRSGIAFGGNDFPPESGANRYKFWILVRPNITATVIVYDR